MSEVGEEDADGFINLNVRVHRDDIYDVIECVEKDTPKIGKRLFKRIAQCMADNEPFSGGDMWSDACREAYESAIE